MRKLLSLLLCLSLILSSQPIMAETSPSSVQVTNNQEFTHLSDEDLLTYTENLVYEELDATFGDDDYIIEDISTSYVSKEYLEELAYNSKSNIFYGYSLAELDEQFQGQRYVFTLGDNGETVVKAFEAFDDSYIYQKALKDVAIGSGVILVNVTASVLTGGTATPVGLIFATSAKTATLYASKGALVGSLSAGILEGIKTGDMEEALKAATTGGSEAFKWSSIGGALVGGYNGMNEVNTSIARNLGGFSDGKSIEYVKGKVEIPKGIKGYRLAELKALNKFGGFKEIAYKNGKKVAYNTSGSTRPDVVRTVGKVIEAVEVKHYNLNNSANVDKLYKVLEQQVKARVKHLPAGSKQRIVLDVTDLGVPKSVAKAVKKEIIKRLQEIYPNIPVDIVGAI